MNKNNNFNDLPQANATKTQKLKFSQNIQQANNLCNPCCFRAIVVIFDKNVYNNLQTPICALLIFHNFAKIYIR